MGATIETIITCDGGNPTTCDGSDWSADQRHKTAKEQREYAASHLGWVRRGGKDYCAGCWQSIKNERASA